MAGASSSNWRGGLREIINFLNGIVRHAGASPHSSPQQPLGQVSYRGPGPPKTGRPPPPPPMIAPAVSTATGGTRSATVWEHIRCPLLMLVLACGRGGRVAL